MFNLYRKAVELAEVFLLIGAHGVSSELLLGKYAVAILGALACSLCVLILLGTAKVIRTLRSGKKRKTKGKKTRAKSSATKRKPRKKRA